MAKSFGAKQRILRPSKINTHVGFLGENPRILNPGDTQRMVFSDCDSGPFWMSEEIQKSRKHDFDTGERKTKNLTKKELLIVLKEKTGLELPPGTNNKIVKAKCADSNISLKSDPKPVIREGWCGKAKGMFQILWERGLINEAEKNKYTVDAKKDAFGVKQNSQSLKYLLENCVDFAEEESLLQTNARKMGVLVDRTPKCHAEIAGEGIEYTWGYGKNHYRRQPLSLKGKKDTFLLLVRQCLSREKCTTNIIRSFSKRARDYMASYYLLTQKKDEVKSIVKDGGNDEPVVVKVEKMKRKFKTHRCAMDFDSKFIDCAVNCSIIDLTSSDDKGDPD